MIRELSQKAVLVGVQKETALQNGRKKLFVTTEGISMFTNSAIQFRFYSLLLDTCTFLKGRFPTHLKSGSPITDLRHKSQLLATRVLYQSTVLLTGLL